MYESEPSNRKDEQLISWVKVLMICAGLWKGPIGTHRRLEKLYNVYSMFMKCSFVTFALLLASELIQLIIVGYDTRIVIGSLGLVISGSKIAVKAVFFMRYRLQDVFREIVRKEQEVWASGCEEIHALYRTKIRFIRGTVLTLFVPSTATVLTMQVTGAFITFKIKQHNANSNVSLEFDFIYQGVFPLNRVIKSKWIVLSEILWGWVSLTYASVTQLIYIVILVSAVIQLQILQIRFRNLMGSRTGLCPSHAEVLEGARKLREHMITHKIIIRFIYDFNQTTKYLLLIDFLLYSFDMASVALTISQMDIIKSWWIIFYFSTLFLQLVMIAWSCNEIKVQSEALGDALFHSRWYLLDKQTKQKVLFMLMRMERPLCMTVGVFGAMTTSSIILVLKAAYSYVNLMRE